jgi:hypothetical protein
MDETTSTHSPRIKALFEQVRDEARERGLVCCDPYEMSDDEERWALYVQPAGSGEDDHENGVDVSITVLTSEHCDGNGLNFGLDVVSHSGRIIGGLCPFNYTDRVWVARDDADAVEERWQLFANAFDADSVVDSIVTFFLEGSSPRRQLGT